MADAVVLDRWSGEGVKVSEVAEALGALRYESAGKRASARTAVMTLVGVAAADDHAYGAAEALRALAGHHPARIVLLRPDPDAVAVLNARATLFGLDTDHRQVIFEEVRLEVGGQAARHLDSIVDDFTLSDLPVAIWYAGSVPDASDPLLTVATAVLIDSRDAPDMGQMRSLLALARRRTLVDLSWKRLTPWRELLSGLFDPPDNRRWLQHIDRVEIAGKPGPRRLLGGWLVAQVGLAPSRVSTTDARHASIRLTARDGSSTATFSVERVEGQRLVAAEALLPGGRSLRATTQLPEDPLAASLAVALTHLRPDRVWERALSAATALADG